MNVTTVEKNITHDIAASLQPATEKFSALIQQRKTALETFQQLGLPGKKHEEYKYTPIASALEKNFDFNLRNPVGNIASIKDFLIPDIQENTIVFINGIFSQEHSTITSPASDITLLSLEEALVQKSKIVHQHLSAYIDQKKDAFANWNTASWSSGLFIHVPAHKKIKSPIVVHHLHDTRQGQVISQVRNLFVVEENSEVTILEKFDSIGHHHHFSNQVTEAVVSKNARLNRYLIQNDAGKCYQSTLTQIYQQPTSRVNTYTFSLNGKLLRNALNLVLDGEGIESHLYGLYLLDGDTLADNHTVVDHKKPNSYSNEIYKGIMDGNSKGVFNGKIYVRPQAQKTNAFQANKNILLTDQASVNTKPQLEIWADDVKCSHGCTSGQLDEEALFYLQSRGISKETARAMMLYAFAAELLESIDHPAIKNYLDTLFSDRLHKNF